MQNSELGLFSNLFTKMGVPFNSHSNTREESDLQTIKLPRPNPTPPGGFGGEGSGGLGGLGGVRSG